MQKILYHTPKSVMIFTLASIPYIYISKIFFKKKKSINPNSNYCIGLGFKNFRLYPNAQFRNSGSDLESTQLFKVQIPSYIDLAKNIMSFDYRHSTQLRNFAAIKLCNQLTASQHG